MNKDKDIFKFFSASKILFFVVSLLILGFAFIVAMTHTGYNRLIESNLENISQLASSNIYNNIRNEFMKYTYVVNTLSDDLLLKSIIEECDSEINEDRQQILQTEIVNYLSRYKEDYEYSIAYFVSAQSNIYYYNGGINKVISQEDEYDMWYYKFVESGRKLALDVNEDQTNGNLTVFVNCRVEDEQGKLLGVIGVGVQMHTMQEMMKYYIQEANVQACLVNEDGLIQVDLDSAYIENVNIFDEPELRDVKEGMLESKNEPFTYWYPGDRCKTCVITQYIPGIDWYLVVYKNNAQEIRDFYLIIAKNAIIYSCVIIFVIAIITVSIEKHNRAMFRVATMDLLTKLPNRRYFYEKILEQAAHNEVSHKVVFMFDIDDFKKINDTMGHLTGDAVIEKITQIVSETLGKENVLARWGGDEFCGIIFGDSKVALDILEKLQQRLHEADFESDLHPTISIGYVELCKIDDIDSIISKADKALYCAKNSGKNRISKCNCSEPSKFDEDMR